MNEEMPVSILIMVIGVFMAGFAQVLLKKAAMKPFEKWYRQYLNALVILAYVLMLLSTLCSVFAYKTLPLSMVPIWTAAGQVFVAVMSRAVLKEKLRKRKLIGISIIVAGIVVFCL